MKRIQLFLLFCIHCCWSLVALGHEGHDHGPVSIKSALEISLKAAREYSAGASPFDIGLLPGSWARLSKNNATIHANQLGYYIVALNNPHEGKVAYFKIRLDGTITGANFTGLFTEMSAKSSNSSMSDG